jgi:hypothetical protein
LLEEEKGRNLNLDEEISNLKKEVKELNKEKLELLDLLKEMKDFS